MIAFLLRHPGVIIGTGLFLLGLAIGGWVILQRREERYRGRR